jgi:50S ribosomal protein L16 3-hydroxylase
MIPTLLGGLSVDAFLADYWQKKPLLIRGAFPGFTGVPGLANANDLLTMAARNDVESRLIAGSGDDWRLDHGPFKPRALKRLVDPWTVLVQGVNLLIESGDQLLREFSFLPYARLDDLMVSYATDGGGVGPHFDSYDVFLVQGLGRRRWRIGRQKQHRLIEGLPVRILADFRPSQEWLLEPGDMLYLPPEWAHDGVAEGECMTWSIGFRAYPAQELAEQFLNHLQDHLEIDGRYADPALRSQKHPAEIGKDMIEQVAAQIDRIRWNRDTVKDFLGCLLTEPKPHIYFSAPESPVSETQFARKTRKSGIKLDIQTQLLFAGSRFFINGEAANVPQSDRKRMSHLADRRHIDSTDDWSAAGANLLYQWYRCGFISF